MIKALWLTSWYPNKLDAMNGDFIQRHAHATSLFCKIDVIHVEADKRDSLRQPITILVNRTANLTENIVLFKPSQLPFIGKIISYFQYLHHFKKQVQQYIALYGKPGIVHVHVPIKAGIIALWIKRKFDIPFVVTEHWTIYSGNSPDPYAKRGFLFKSYTKKILEQTSAFLPVSRDLGNTIKKLIVPIPFTVVPNVADTNFFNYESGNEEKEERFSFVHVSTLNHQKNPEAILRAYGNFCRQHSNTNLIIVGDANEQLKQYAASLNIPAANLLFTGLVSYEEVSAILKKCDALVMFSRYENLPCTIIEALCCGLPVISTDVGGIRELANESNGYLIKKEDESLLLNAMIEMYQQYDRFNREKISTDAIEKFSYEKVGGEIVEIYKRVLQHQ